MASTNSTTVLENISAIAAAKTRIESVFSTLGVSVPSRFESFGSVLYEGVEKLKDASSDAFGFDSRTTVWPGCVTDFKFPSYVTSISGTFNASWFFSGMATNAPGVLGVVDLNNVSQIFNSNPRTVTTMTFAGCPCKSLSGSCLTAVLMPDVVQTGMFQGAKVEEVYFPQLKTAASRMFAECSSLRKVTFGEMTRIPESCFCGCSSLSDFSTTGGNVSYIGGYAFSGCSTLSSIPSVLASAVSISGGAFKGCQQLTSVSFPNVINVLGASETFALCTSLTRAHFVNFIGYVAMSIFSGCSALSVVEFSSPTGIYTDAFDGCTSLRAIGMSAARSVPQMVAVSSTRATLPVTTFANDFKIIVPMSLLSSFYAASGWSMINKSYYAGV